MIGSLVATAFWAMVPAYVPNNAAVLAGGGRPIDGGRSVGGRRLLGDGKTWRGTIGGGAAGVLLAIGLNVLQSPVATLVGVDLPLFQPLRGAVGLALGAMVGDVVASFLKRRTGRERGTSFPGLDQLDFVIGGLALAALFAPDWFLATFTPPRLVVVLVATPVLHVGTNALAYLAGLKNEPY